MRLVSSLRSSRGYGHVCVIRAAARCVGVGARGMTGVGQRRWRTLDLGTTKTFLAAEAPRVDCRRHGIRVAWVPWARHDAWFTFAFEDQVAWLTVVSTKTSVVALMRIAWTTVGAICGRVMADRLAEIDPLDGLVRIGIDEIPYRYVIMFASTKGLESYKVVIQG